MENINFFDILACVGLTIIVTQSFIFKFIRKYLCDKNEYLGKLFSCSMCFGFWSIFIVYIFKLYLPILNYGFISSLFSYVIYLLIKPLMDNDK